MFIYFLLIYYLSIYSLKFIFRLFIKTYFFIYLLKFTAHIYVKLTNMICVHICLFIDSCNMTYLKSKESI